MQSEEIEKIYAQASKRVQEFFRKEDYYSSSSPEQMERVFVVAIKEYLTEDQNDLWTLGTVAEEFEANPAIHLVADSGKIYLAMDLLHALFEQDSEEITKITNQLNS